MTEPGWYPDPAGGPTRRYWDGNAWYDGIPAPPRRPIERAQVLAGLFGGITCWLAVTIVGAVAARPAGEPIWVASSASSMIASAFGLTVGLVMLRSPRRRQAGAALLIGVAVIAVMWAGICLGGQLSDI
jgi:FtsH-binding integral membrane protein